MLDSLEETARFVFLHWVRCTAMISPLPIFGGKEARMLKVALAVILGTMLAFLPDAAPFADPGFTPVLAILVIKEFLLGILMGYLALVTFASLRIAGHLIGAEMGFNMANIQDPITGVNTQLMAHLFEAMGLVIFFMARGHHTLMRALAHSFKSFPVGTFTLQPEMVPGIAAYTAGVFMVGLQIAAPVFTTMIVIGVALAILSKVAPQLQIMMFAFPVKVLGGLLMLIASLGTIVPAMASSFERLEDFLYAILEV